MNYDKQKINAIVGWFVRVADRLVPLYRKLCGMGLGDVYVGADGVAFFIDRNVPVSAQHPLVRGKLTGVLVDGEVYPSEDEDLVAFTSLFDAAQVMASRTDHSVDEFLYLTQDIQSILRAGQQELGLPQPDYNLYLDWFGLSCFGTVGHKTISNLIRGCTRTDGPWIVDYHTDMVPTELQERVKQVTSNTEVVCSVPVRKTDPGFIRDVRVDLSRLDSVLRSIGISVDLSGAYTALDDAETHLLDEITRREEREKRMGLLATRAKARLALAEIEEQLARSAG